MPPTLGGQHAGAIAAYAITICQSASQFARLTSGQIIFAYATAAPMFKQIVTPLLIRTALRSIADQQFSIRSHGQSIDTYQGLRTDLIGRLTNPGAALEDNSTTYTHGPATIMTRREPHDRKKL